MSNTEPSAAECMRTNTHEYALPDTKHCRDRAAIDRVRSAYQYDYETPLAPRDYGMPHQVTHFWLSTKRRL
jgi:hypothetical protein